MLTKFNVFFQKLNEIPLLIFRLILAFGFYEPAMMKIKNFSYISVWFKELGIIFPTLMTYVVTITETAGIILLIIGFQTRIISLLLMIVMLVAIGVVHWDNGFSVTDNGFEIPFYYYMMLFMLLIYGGGKYSLDHYISKGIKKR